MAHPAVLAVLSGGAHPLPAQPARAQLTPHTAHTGTVLGHALLPLPHAPARPRMQIEYGAGHPFPQAAPGHGLDTPARRMPEELEALEHPQAIRIPAKRI
jgi:hypothetical protein